MEKAINGNDPQIKEIGMNSMTYIQKISTCDKAKKDSNNYTIRCFLKYVINNNNPIEEAKKFGNDVTKMLNSYDYKYKTIFEYGGDITTEGTDIAVNTLLTRDVHKHCVECSLPYIKKSSFFKDEYLMTNLFIDDADPKTYFNWIKKGYIEDKEDKKIEDKHDKENTYDDDQNKTD